MEIRENVNKTAVRTFGKQCVQCIQKVFRLLHFLHFVMLQPNANIVFPLINLHSIPHNEKVKKGI